MTHAPLHPRLPPEHPAYSADDVAFSPRRKRTTIKEQICDIGRRIWAREYCDGNGGNISARLGPDRFICTPTGVSKGFMTPDMMCMVDGKGKQLGGTWKRSSEITTHMAIFHSTPEAVSVCHAHPVHAGAFAIKGMQPPPRLIPELEVFVGTVAYTPYKTPGSPEIAAEIFPLAPKHQSILMGNHGVICWGKSVEDAYFKMEITDAYCRTVILAQAIPGSASIPCDKLPELLNIKKSLGLPDDRYDLKPAGLCEVDPWTQMCGSHGCSSPVTPFNPMTNGVAIERCRDRSARAEAHRRNRRESEKVGAGHVTRRSSPARWCCRCGWRRISGACEARLEGRDHHRQRRGV